MRLPNYTQISNDFLEQMSKYTGSTVMVFLAISRKTIGWHKTGARVPYTMLMEMTGIKHRQTLNEAIAALVDGGWITVTGDSKRGYYYDLNMEIEGTSSFNERTSSKSELDLVQKVNEQNDVKADTVKKSSVPKETKETSKKESTDAPETVNKTVPDASVDEEEDVPKQEAQGILHDLVLSLSEPKPTAEEERRRKAQALRELDAVREKVAV